MNGVSKGTTAKRFRTDTLAVVEHFNFPGLERRPENLNQRDSHEV